MRQLNQITVGRILLDLWEELRAAGISEDKLFYINNRGKKRRKLPISRLTFYRLEKKLNLPATFKARGKYVWRTYTEEQYNEVKAKLKEEFNDFAQLKLQ